MSSNALSFVGNFMCTLLYNLQILFQIQIILVFKYKYVFEPNHEWPDHNLH